MAQLACEKSSKFILDENLEDRLSNYKIQVFLTVHFPPFKHGLLEHSFISEKNAKHNNTNKYRD